MSCQPLSDFVAGALGAAEAEAFRDHLADCVACQAGLLAAMQLDTRAAAAGARAAAAVTPIARRWRRPAVATAAAVAVIAAAAAIALIAVRRPDGDRRPVTIALARERSIEGRFTAPGFDQHRPYSVDRAAAPATEVVPARVLADLEADGDLRGLAAGQLLAGNRTAARAALAAAAADSDTASDRAVLALVDGRAADAVLGLDAALAASPDHAQARWNLGLAYRDLGLPLMSAVAFARVAGRGEPGWSSEAAGRADGERAAILAASRDYQRFYDGARAFAAGTGAAPEPAQWRAFPGIARLFFYDALRATASSERLAALAPIAAALDTGYGGSTLADAVAAIGRGDLARRRPLAERYGALIAGGLDSDAISRLIADARRAGAIDIVLGAMVRGGPRGVVGADHLADYVRLAEATRDPWLSTLAIEQTGLGLGRDGRYRDAVATLVTALDRCRSAGLDYRCARITLSLADSHLAAHEVSEARRWAAEALRFSRRAGDRYLELQSLHQHALIEHFADDVTATGAALVRAYAGEILARAPADCSYAPYAHELIALSAITRLDPTAARREYDLAVALRQRCQLGLDLESAFLTAQVLAATGSAAEVAAARIAIDGLRAGARPGLAALIDHIEGRLLLRHDAGPARALLRKAIAAVASGPGISVDIESAKARAYSFALLADDAASHGQAAAAVDLIAEEAGIAAPARCAVAVAIDDQAVVVVRGPDGIDQLRVSRRRPGALDASALVGADLQARLGGCDQVDVIARPPIHGRPRLLGGDIAWRYRGGHPVVAARSPAPVRLVVSDVEPPAELGLARLARHRSQGAAIELTGPTATPGRVLARLGEADVIEIHAHGVIDHRVADGAFIALSPDADRSFALTARQVRALRLPRAPLVVLGACDAGEVAPYFHAAWSLPAAFIAAGARAVIASTAPMPDDGASQFLAEVSAQIQAGTSAAVAVRDVRRQWRSRPGAAWVEDIVVFE